MKNPTMLCHYVRALTDSVRRQGKDPLPLLKAAGIPEHLAADPNTRIPFAQCTTLIRKTWRALDDENLGMSTPPLPIGAFFYASLLMAGAPTLRHALQRGMAFYGYVCKGYQLRLIEQGCDVVIEVKLSQPQMDPDHVLAEFLLLLWHRYSCWLSGQKIVLKHVGFDFPPPAHEAEYQYLFSCPRDFNQEQSSLRFSRSYLDQPVIRNEQDSEAFIKRSPMGLMENPIHDDSYETKIRLLIEAHEEEGYPPFEAIAEALHTTPKTLRQKLKNEGISYQKIKDVIRRDSAIHYLTQQRCSIAEIALKVGFTETGAFIRAFKGWTGVTPGAYRNQAD
ncbi:MAG: AraC family transcriptional regulator [Motiliproteus sp.]